MAIKGAILGDILGSTYEFGRPKDLGWVNVPLLDKKLHILRMIRS